MYDHDKKVTADDINYDDYRFVEKVIHGEGETSYVQLIGETPWSGTVFQYGNLRLLAPQENDAEHATLAFSYRIIDSPLRKESLEENTAFKNYLGAVLEHILTDALETGEYNIGSNDSDDNIEEPTS